MQLAQDYTAEMQETQDLNPGSLISGACHTDCIAVLSLQQC